jgi:cell division protein FtsW
VLLVLALYGALVWRGLALARRAALAGHGFGAHLALGVTVWVGLQAFVNIGVTLGLLPTKGLTLPLLSAGGSSLVVVCFALGLVARLHRELEGGASAAEGEA